MNITTIYKKLKDNMALTTALSSYPSTYNNLTIDQNTSVSYVSAGEYIRDEDFFVWQHVMPIPHILGAECSLALARLSYELVKMPCFGNKKMLRSSKYVPLNTS